MWKAPATRSALQQAATQAIGGHITASKRDNNSNERQFSKTDVGEPDSISRWIDQTIEAAKRDKVQRIRFRIWESGGARSIYNAVYEFSTVGKSYHAIRTHRSPLPAPPVAQKTAPLPEAAPEVAPEVAPEAAPEAPPAPVPTPVPAPVYVPPPPCTNCQQLSANLTSVQNLMASTQQRSQELADHVLKLRGDLTDTRLKLQAAREQLADHKVVIAKRDELNQQVLILQNEKQNQQRAYQRLEQELQEANRKIERLIQKNKELAAENKEMTESMQSIEVDVYKLTDMLRRMNEDD